MFIDVQITKDLIHGCGESVVVLGVEDGLDDWYELRRTQSSAPGLWDEAVAAGDDLWSILAAHGLLPDSDVYHDEPVDAEECVGYGHLAARGRPGHGLAAALLDDVFGRRACDGAVLDAVQVAAGTAERWTAYRAPWPDQSDQAWDEALTAGETGHDATTAVYGLALREAKASGIRPTRQESWD